MKNLSLVAGALLAATPLTVLMSGCGGSSGGFFATPTPVPTSTPIPTTTGTPSAQQTSNFTLGNGQRAVLRYTTSGTKINGTLQILASSANAVKTSAITYTFAVGTYTVTGTFTPPRGFSITGTLNGSPLFTMTGQLPTTTQTGSYSLTVDGQTESGTIPRIGDVTPTATPRPTTTPTTPSGGTVTSNLTFTKSSDSNFVVVPITTASLNLNSTSGITSLGYGGQGRNSSTRDAVGVFTVLFNPKTGQQYGLTDGQSGNYIINVPGGTFSNYFTVKSGIITVTSLTASTVTLKYDKVVYAANEGGNGKGSVTVSGTVSGPYTTK